MTETSIEDLFRVAEVELSYKRFTDTKCDLKIRDAKSAYEVLMAAWDRNKMDLQEQFKILLTSADCTCLGIAHIATGGISQCSIDTRIIFATALKANATNIILAHNHPSGNLKASDADIRQTEKLFHAGKLLDIHVADHLILSSQGYLSMANEGLMP